MKKPALLALTLLFALYSFSQEITSASAMMLIEKNKAAVGIPGDDPDNIIVSNAFEDALSGLRLVYIQQQYKGVPVYNQVKTLAFKGDKLVSVTGNFISDVASRVNQMAVVPGITPATAVRKVLALKNLTTESTASAQRTDNERYFFGKMGVASEDITARLLWVPSVSGKNISLAWQVFLAPSTSSDYLLVDIDAATGTWLNETNLTVYCDFDHDHAGDTLLNSVPLTDVPGPSVYSPGAVNGATYRVIPYPAESPNHPGGAPALRSNPWTLAPGNATSLKWHSTGTADYDYTRGNNVWAREDRDGVNTTVGNSAISTSSPDPLTFDFTPDFTQAPTQTSPVPNQQFNITNLFYWNNIIHDMLYQYGFDEVSGNFQADNQGRGGQGNDYVIAEAQDGAGTNNANFATPQDGSSGRMQMYLWSGSPQKDGDVDNGIIVHEFGHGVSNRLTGGPSQAGCLTNQEQMGEGWSDYLALMTTQNWATATVSDGFTSPRGIGTYAVSQPTTGLGIRPRKYTTNMAVNELTYADLPGQAVPHGVGFIWASMLWDLTWDIIQMDGINPNIFDANAIGGNTVALKLVMEGMKLQPCSPGMVDGRDAILKADEILYNGKYHCTILKAFARRGLGVDANQGSVTSSSDGTAGFSIVEANIGFSQSVTQQQEGLTVTYRHRVTAGPCAAVANYTIRDTLPANVTYVAGGNYNAATRVVSFPVSLAASQSQDYALTVQINSGSWYATTNLIDETLTGTTIPSTWTTSSINANNFIVSAAQSHSAPNAFFGINAPAITDYKLTTVNSYALGSTAPVFSFWHKYHTEEGWDGGVVEISTDNGTTWSDLGADMTENGYNSGMGVGSNNPIGGRNAFSGNSNGFIKTTVNLQPYANKSVKLRFRVGSDDNTSEEGWYIDDILLQARAQVNIRSSLFNAAGSRVAIRDTFTIILQNTTCTPASISLQPVSINACEGSNAVFSAATGGTNTVTYQWQVSNNGGVSFSDIPGATNATLTLPAVTGLLNGYQYRAVINDPCTTNLLTTAATLNVNTPIAITQQPAARVVCEGSSISIAAAASGTGLSYQWQVSVNNGAFTNIVNNAVYAGANTSTLQVIAPGIALTGNKYRLLLTSPSCGTATTAEALLTVNSQPQVTLVAGGTNTLTPYTPTSLTANVSPTAGYTYTWYRDGAVVATAATATIPITVDALGNYYVVVTNAAGCSATSSSFQYSVAPSNTLFIYPNPATTVFQVRYYNGTAQNTARQVNVYDSKGARVYHKSYMVTGVYDQMNVDLGNAPGGLYLVELVSANGKRITSGKVLVK